MQQMFTVVLTSFLSSSFFIFLYNEIKKAGSTKISNQKAIIYYARAQLNNTIKKIEIKLEFYNSAHSTSLVNDFQFFYSNGIEVLELNNPLEISPSMTIAGKKVEQKTFEFEFKDDLNLLAHSEMYLKYIINLTREKRNIG